MGESTAPGSLTIGPIDGTDVQRYADAARDHNPVHLDAAFAQRLGLDGPIVHGMFVMGQFERVIRLWTTDHAVENLSIRFAKPVPVGAVVTLQARIAQAAPMADGHARTLLRLVATVERGVVAIGTAAVTGPPLSPP